MRALIIALLLSCPLYAVTTEELISLTERFSNALSGVFIAEEAEAPAEEEEIALPPVQEESTEPDAEESVPEESAPAEDTPQGESIVFSGGTSSIVLREGREEVVLSSGAEVQVGSMTIRADRISLYGDNWRYVDCEGNASVLDPERGISIRTSDIWYDRTEERILISSWYEVDDTVNEVTAMGASLEYRLSDEMLRLDKNVSLLKSTDTGIMRCQAESVIFSRDENMLSLRGNASVDWDGDRYGAQVVTVDLDTDEITLEGGISGNING